MRKIVIDMCRALCYNAGIENENVSAGQRAYATERQRGRRDGGSADRSTGIGEGLSGA
ncbi:MAG: hypothetical protein JWN14_15 [Chthonomonadales bacterium]|nr:hypothetical protein [Chthonomonadales bacterium]